MVCTHLRKASPPRCARFAPRFVTMIETLPADSPERQQLESKLAAMRSTLLRLADKLLDMSPFDALRSAQHAALQEE